MKNFVLHSLECRRQFFLSIRNEGVIKGSGDYWEKCFTLRQPVPLFLQPVMDKVCMTSHDCHVTVLSDHMMWLYIPR